MQNPVNIYMDIEANNKIKWHMTAEIPTIVCVTMKDQQVLISSCAPGAKSAIYRCLVLTLDRLHLLTIQSVSFPPHVYLACHWSVPAQFMPPLRIF